VPRISREYERFAFARQMKENIVGLIQSAVDSGELPSSLDPAVAMRVLTTAVVGVAALRLSDRVAAGEEADNLAADVLDIAFAGLAAGVPLRSKAPRCDAQETGIAEANRVPTAVGSAGFSRT